MIDVAEARTAHLDATGRLLPLAERQRRLMRLKVWHTLAKAIIARFDRFEDMTRSALEGMHIAIPGRPGVGKSQLVKKIRNDVLAREAKTAGYAVRGTAIDAPGGDWRPVLRVPTPPEVTVASFAEAFLHALADEDPAFGDKGQKTRRVRRKLQEQRTRIVLVDEFQHLTDHRTEKFAYAAADWLKGILNEQDGEPDEDGVIGEFFVHAAFFGTHSMQTMFVGNGQLASRARGVFPLAAYDWIDPAQRALYRDTLHAVDRMLPFPEPTFADETVHFDLHRATDGVMRRIAAILQVAGFEALALGQTRITPELLKDAFDTLAWELGSSDFHPRANPWREKKHDPGFRDAPVPDTTRKTRIRGTGNSVAPSFGKKKR
ncbi:AAA family ATPase [Methylobacterium oryzae]